MPFGTLNSLLRRGLAGGSTLRQFSIKKEPTNAEETSDPGVARALAPAVALAQVEVYGTIHMSLNYMDYGTAPRERHRSRNSTASHASNVGVRGRERWRRADGVVPGRDQCLDGALEQHCAHFELRLA